MIKTIKSTTSLFRYKSSDGNIIICEDKNIKLNNTTITINGKNNIVFLGKSIKLENCSIAINGNNNIIYLSENKYKYSLSLNMYNNSTFYSGKDNYFNGILKIIISEYSSVIIGDDCMFSFDIWIRTADPHLIYDGITKKRINLSKNIYVGDHVWVGQNAFLLKGSKLGSGCIIGASGVKSGIIYSNTICAGNPAKEIKENIFWKGDCVHRWTKKDTKKNLYYNESNYIFTNKNNKNIYKSLDKYLKKDNIQERYDFIISKIVNNKDRYRFSISKDPYKIKIKKKIKRFLDLFSD